MHKSKFILLALVMAGAVISGPLAAQGAEGVTSGAIVINESDADTPGSDVLEFVELYDGGFGNTDLTGYVLVFYNGSSDTSYTAIDLAGFSTDNNGFFLLGNAAVSPAPSIIFNNNGLQNGADAVALYLDSVASFPAGTPVTAVNLVDAVVYDTNDGDDAGLLGVLTPGQPQINEGGGAGGSSADSIGRCQDGAGGQLNTTQFVTMTPTPGASNGNNCNPFTITVTQDVPACGPVIVSVSGATPGAELFNLASFSCTGGSGPLFGVDLDAFQQLFLPLGSAPFHVLADSTGAYNASFTTLCIMPMSVEAVSIRLAPGGAINQVSATTGCVNISL